MRRRRAGLGRRVKPEPGVWGIGRGREHVKRADLPGRTGTSVAAAEGLVGHR